MQCFFIQTPGYLTHLVENRAPRQSRTDSSCSTFEVVHGYLKPVDFWPDLFFVKDA